MSPRTTRLTLPAYIAVNVTLVRRARSGAVLALAIGLTLIAAFLAAPTTAQAHPLGNFSVNHVTTVRISDDEVRLRYLLDQAEIPTVQERGLSTEELLQRKRAEVQGGLVLSVDGRRVPLQLDGRGRASFPEGSGGLPTSRFEFRLTASVDSPRSVRLRDNTFEDRVGWRAIVSAPGAGTAVRTGVPSSDPTEGLRRYPDDLLSSPVDRRDASFSVKPGDGTLTAPRGEGAASEGSEVAASEGGAVAANGRASEGGFAGLFERASQGEGVLALLLLAAFGWGALHALSPGHGKAMVAAYLVGTRGTPRHAIALGATVTVTHTIGVFALGLVTLALSQYVLPEDLYPWLNLAAGLLVVAIGAGVLRSRIRHAKHHHHHHHHHDVTRRGLIGMGAAAGLIPCPSALVVLLAAVSQHEVALGMLLIVAFSLGLAATLTALGLAVVYARRIVPRLKVPRLAAALPAASALLIVAVGCVLTVNAVPEALL
jgi:nickel/cobalt transporter (NicO) family protein